MGAKGGPLACLTVLPAAKVIFSAQVPRPVGGAQFDDRPESPNFITNAEPWGTPYVLDMPGLGGIATQLSGTGALVLWLRWDVPSDLRYFENVGLGFCML